MSRLHDLDTIGLTAWVRGSKEWHMFRLRHPFSGHIYSALGDGRVGVEKDGQSGVFDRYGSWLSGDIRVADLEMCRWVGTHHAGAQMSRHSGSFPERSVAGGQDRTPLSKEIR